MVVVGDGGGMSTMPVLMDNGEVVAAEMGMDLHTSSVATSQLTLGLLHLLLSQERLLHHHHSLALLLLKHHLMGLL